MRPCLVGHYHEIALKKKNRDFFERKLLSNVKIALGDLPYRSLRLWSRRVVLELHPGGPVEKAASRVGRVFGLVNYARAWIVPSSVHQLETALGQLLPAKEFESFRISAKRSDKRYPLTTPEIENQLGSFVQSTFEKRVSLKEPELTCHVKILGSEALLHFEKLRGPGGLPVSSSGKVVILISGGIDSPVAAYKMMKRGCRPIFVHFHSHPHTSLDAQHKVMELVDLLCRYQPPTRVYMVPFAPAQRQIVALTPAPTRILLYRRLMLRISNRIARREKAKALVTGDSLGQVSSQTLDNIRAVTEVSRLPVLQPLIGEDKEEIISVARKIGTFGVSIGSDDDCCSLFVPKHPITNARIEQVERAEEQLQMEELVTAALRAASRSPLGGLVRESPTPQQLDILREE